MNIGFDAKRIFHNSSGLGNYSRHLVEILNEFFPENKLLLYNPKPKKVDLLELGPQILEILPTKMWSKFSPIWRSIGVIKSFQKHRLQIYHGLSGEIPLFCSKTNVKSVVTIHDLIFLKYPKFYSFFDRKIYFKKFSYALKNADKIVSISESTKRDIIDYFDINPEKIEVIYQGCDKLFKEQFSQEIKKKTLKKYNLPSKFILNVGTIEERKNVLTLIKCIKNIDSVNLVVVGGKRAYYKKVSEYIRNHNLQDRIFFLESLNTKELAILFQLSTLFVYPSIYEGFGIPIIEALFSKTPVITSTGSCFYEAGGPFSSYVNPTDKKQLEKEIISLLENPKRREEMSDKSYKFAQKFNNKNIAKTYLKLYNKLII